MVHKSEPLLNPENQPDSQTFDQVSLQNEQEIVQRCEMMSSFRLPNGATFTGQLNDRGGREGVGIQDWPDGTRYIGEWRDDKANGWGKLRHGDGDVYMGDWKDDKAHGYGKYFHRDNGLYEGYW